MSEDQNSVVTLKVRVTPEFREKIVETAIRYAINFDLLVPPYESVNIISLTQMKNEIMNSKIF